MRREAYEFVEQCGVLAIRVPVFLYDAFPARRFGGNVAGVVFLEQDMPPEWMQDVAAELDAATTGFVDLQTAQGRDARGRGRWRLVRGGGSGVIIDLAAMRRCAATYIRPSPKAFADSSCVVSVSWRRRLTVPGVRHG